MVFRPPVVKDVTGPNQWNETVAVPSPTEFAAGSQFQSIPTGALPVYASAVANGDYSPDDETDKMRKALSPQRRLTVELVSSGGTDIVVT